MPHPYGDAENAIQRGADALKEQSAIWANIDNADERLRYIAAVVIASYQKFLLNEEEVHSC